MFGIWKEYRGLGTDREYKESKMNPHYFYLGYMVGTAMRPFIGGER
jgi:hypothetical protein